ncbi:MAG: efflux RND transporter permease subunit, partial [bacterium]|nr:efflux RND transporter permease subunit [bacterium]
MKVKKRPAGTSQLQSAEDIAASGEKPIAIKGAFLKSYTRFLTYALQNRITILLSSFASLIIFLLIWLYAVGLEKPVQFFPAIDPGNLYINLDPPEGADLDYIDSIVKKIEIAITDPGDTPGDPNLLTLDRYSDAYQPKTHEMAGGKTFIGPSDMGNIEHIFGRSVKLGGGFSFDDN